MMSKRALPIIIPAILLLVLVFAKSWGNKKSEPATRYEKILTLVANILEQGHFDPQKLDDTFSKKVFNSYLNELDPDKLILLNSDVANLKKYENSVDNELRTGRMELVPAVDNIFNTRVKEAEKIYSDILARPFDFSVNESVMVDREKMPFPAGDSERKEAWRKRLKYMTLERYSEALETREKNKGTKDFVVKADSTLERESRERVLKIWDKYFDRLGNRFNLDEKFNRYVNTIAETMDPHTQFFAPVEKRAFDEAMSGAFYGIGAQLGEQDGNIKIVSVMTGSPAWKSGEIQVNDIVQKVAQGDTEPVDITGYETTDAVKLIRGAKGTVVKLTLRKPDGTVKVVPIVREKIVQEEAYARSAVIEGDQKIGYIFLPEFYAAFDDPNGARSATDVANEVKKLMAENVDGIVIDLRYNGGGSLQDVVQMVGLFIDEGPIVQVKDRDGQPSLYRDRDKGVLYRGPLAVMINEYSASASEIFAAAIQDYNRGIVVGTQSYGKGTVQRNIGLDRNSGFVVGNSDLGTLKLTLQKFYRINGGSTQLNGVVPDVILPDNLMFTKNKEKDNPNALKYDAIAETPFTAWPDAQMIGTVKKQYQSALDTNTAFQTIKNNAQMLSNLNEQPVTLLLPAYQAYQKKIREAVKQNESLQTLAAPINISFVDADKQRIAQMDKDKGDRFNNWLKALSTDRYLQEAGRIVGALAHAEKTARN